MSPSTMTDPLLREVPTLIVTDSLGEAVRTIVGSGLPALPVAEDPPVVGSLDACLVICLPGRLAFYESEDPGRRAVLLRM